MARGASTLRAFLWRYLRGMDAHRWSRSAWALALVFGSLPLVGRLVLGTWEFGGAAEIAGLALLVGAYFQWRVWRIVAIPDAATLLDRASRLAASGRVERAVAVLTKAIRQSPKLWQAYQYRGELRLRLGEFSVAAQDFSEAIRLAPNEPHLHVLREQAFAAQLQRAPGE
jgi:tetratricopeptide (TPR) repeat protein